MKKRIAFWIINSIIIIGFLFPSANVPAMPLKSAVITFISPIYCPAGGCSAGQRLNMRTSFDLGLYQPGSQKNVQVCAYTPIDWSVNNFLFDPIGTLTAGSYSIDSSNCGPAPSGYQNIAGVSSALQNAYFGDSLDFSFRLGKTATSNGSVYLRVYEFNGSNWFQSQQAFIFVPVMALVQNVFVAQNANECPQNLPCFINSRDDLAGGIGTGLKDAVDALNTAGVIQIIGIYSIKNNAIIIDKSLTIKGIQQATITSDGTTCNQPMLTVSSGFTLENITINDGACINPGRNLIQIDNMQPVNILSSVLTSGKDAILVGQANALITIQSSTISNNSGYAVNRISNSSNGDLRITANNIYANRSGAQVNCASKGIVDHNYWGFNINPDTATQNCSFQSGKQLGSPILSSISSSGLQVEKVTVNAQTQSFFENQVSVSHSPFDPDFDLFIVNHGSSPGSIPFLVNPGMNNLIPCSNFYDIFLADPTATTSTLNLTIRYNLNNACIASIESASYCGQNDQALFPMWWFDPNQLITSGWDTTGQAPSGPFANGASGQTTTCDLVNKNITTQIDSSGRPGINSDLNFTPFVIAVNGNPAAVVLTSFTASAGDSLVTLGWQTSSELNTAGYYVQRRLQGNSDFSSISPFISRTGSNTTGSTYSFQDLTVSNNHVYEYRLEIVGSNFQSVYSNIITATPMYATITPTFTNSPTITQTSTASITTTPTVTATRTVTRTSTRTRTPSRTSYRAPTLVRTPFRSLTPSRTPFPSRTTIFHISQTNNSPTVVITTDGQRPTIFSTQSGSGEGGYPGPVNTSVPGSTASSYPVPDSTQASVTINPNETLQVTPSPNPLHSAVPKPTKKRNETSSSHQPVIGWVYYALGAIIAICVLLLVGYFLWKKGILKLPG